MTPPAVTLRNLAVRVGRSNVLQLEALQVDAGQLVALLGPNGAGKSTLLRCLLGTQPRVRGEVSVLNRPIGSLTAKQLAGLRQRVGYVPQHLPASCEIPLTVREVVAIGRTGLAGLLRPLGREDWRIIDEWIARLGLVELVGRRFTDISGGEQRKTLIARAMVQQPELLLLDEPTANLDIGWRERLVALVEELYRTCEITIILVCHELEVLPPSGQRIVLLDNGRLLADGPSGQVLSADRIASLYGAGLGVMHRNGRWALLPAGVDHA
jgi:iron complex transport system ATP-binding protein